MLSACLSKSAAAPSRISNPSKSEACANTELPEMFQTVISEGTSKSLFFCSSTHRIINNMII